MTQFGLPAHTPLYRPGMAKPIHGFASKLEWAWHNAFTIAGWQPEYIGDRCTWADFRFAGVNFYAEVKPLGEQFLSAAMTRIPRGSLQYLLICQGRPTRECCVSFSLLNPTTKARTAIPTGWRGAPSGWSLPRRDILDIATTLKHIDESLAYWLSDKPLCNVQPTPVEPVIWNGEEPPIALSGMQCGRCGEDVMLDDAQEIGQFQLCDYCRYVSAKAAED